MELKPFEELSDIEKIKIIYKARRSFVYFNRWVFPYSFKLWKGNEDGTWVNPPEGVYVPCEHTHKWAQELEENKLTAKLCARKHLKSTTLYSHVMWKLWKCQDVSFEGLYLSFKEEMAAYHTANIKQLIKNNPWFKDVYELNKAETYLSYSWSPGEEGKFPVRFKVVPAGMFGFKRGRHPRVVWCDDVLADPKNELNMAVINTITNVFFQDVMSLPQEGGELHVWGTPQDDTDLFFQIKKRGRVKSEENPGGFHWSREPAIKNWKNKEVVWKELFTFDRLMEIRDEILDRAFNKEYMCSPVRSENAFFKRAELEAVAEDRENLMQLNTDNNVFAGWDLGKKRHPSHFTVFEMVGGKAVQIYQEFWDGVDYNVQLGRVMRLKERLMIDKVAYDSTRGEFSILEEQGKLPGWLEGISFTNKSKQAMASALEKRVGQKNISLINDQRQINVMLQVNGELKAVETDEGHGDSFWSNGLALLLASEPMDKNPGIVMDLDEYGEIGAEEIWA